MVQRSRIFLTGVGGQGALSATTLLAHVAVDNGIEVVAGEIHGMAQRGGVVESMVLLGGWKSPKIDTGEADILLGFDLLETRRALPYLRTGGAVFSATEILPPPGVLAGQEKAPDMDFVKAEVDKIASKAFYVPLRKIGMNLGVPQIGNTALLGALCASKLLPFALAELEGSICRHLPERQVEANLQAARQGAEIVSESKK